jgi:protein-S-isoprenylcysteine O-methyltransferase Ste14
MTRAESSAAGTCLGAEEARDPHPRLVRLGTFLFKRRKYVLTLTFLAVALCGRPRQLFGSATWDLALDASGIAVALCGQSLRAAVIGLAYIKRGGKSGTIHADTLVQRGLFAHSRNPLYLGNGLEFLGLCMVLNSPVGYLVGVPLWTLAYTSIVLAEESYLRAKFGPAYESYCRRVNRFVPSLRGLRRTLGSMTFDWRRLIRKEFGATFVWITIALGLLLWERYVWQGYPGMRPALPAVLALWAPAVVGYLTAMGLKKAGRLGSD